MEKKQKKEYIQIIILGIVLLFITISIIFSSQISVGIKRALYKADIKVSDTDLVVHFIDIGQGDAIAITFPNDKVMLIDSGPKSSQNYLVEYIKNNVLKSKNNLTIDWLILTHSDTDHSGGMSAVFSEFEIKNFYRPNIASADEDKSLFGIQSNVAEYAELLSLANIEKDINIEVINQNYDFYIDKVHIEIFAPLKIYAETNEMSPIIKISYNGKSFLFAGDIQSQSEQDMLDMYEGQMDADVLKVAHHGSDNATSINFIKAVSPDYAVICVGNNSYGHPSFNTVSNLQKEGAKVVSTQSSAIRFVCGDEGLKLLDSKDIHSYEFIDWWIIALVLDAIVLAVLIPTIFKTVKKNKIESKLKKDS